MAPGDYRLEIAGQRGFVPAVPLSLSRLPWNVSDRHPIEGETNHGV
jgi:hypothetical protein